MERSFVLVLTVVTLVTATPHGYGVKGGASAKAEASAVAGTFGDLGPIPLSIPSGAGYSGSFSKSSSSSFASSSASASSSSYSFSGSGSNGISGIGIDKGCSSGTCSGIGSTGSSSNGALQFAGANAVSAAQAKALAGGYTPCQGPKCDGSPSEKCPSGHCPTTLKGQNECSTGNCQPSSVASQSDLPTDGSSEKQRKDQQNEDFDGSNDFAVNFNRKTDSKPPGDLNGQHSNKEKPYDSISGCSNGKCGPTDSFHSNIGNNQNKPPAPSTYLTTPKEKPPCTTPNCNYPTQDNGFLLNGPPNSGLPSSYNVPIQSATNPPNTFYSSPTGSGKQPTYPNNENGGVAGGPCTSPNCDPAHNLGASNIPNYHFGQQGPTNQGLCATGRCGISLPTNGKTSENSHPIGSAKTPNYSYGGISSNVPSGQPGCKTPDCAELPTYSGSSPYQSNNGCNGVGCAGTFPTGSGTKPSVSGTHVYSGGFGGSSGFLDKTSGNAGYNHGQGVNGGFGSTQSHGSFEATKPHELSPASKGPTQLPSINSPSGSFGITPAGGSSGATMANELNSNHGSTLTSSNVGSTGTFGYTQPNKAPAIPGSQFSHSNPDSYGATPALSAGPIGSSTYPENSGVYKPTSSNIGNHPSHFGSIDGSAQSSHANSGSNSNHGIFGIPKSNNPSNYQGTTGYTGNFGGAIGTSGGSSPTFGSSGLHNKPSSSNVGTDGEEPKYTGGFGGPTGILKPNDYNVPSSSSSLTSTGSLGRTSCVNGNCGPKSTTSSNPQSTSTSAHNLAASSAIASANAVAYSGGFGGPPGVLKPYDDGKINNPAHGNLASGHSPTPNTGNSDTLSINGKNSESGSSVPSVNAGAYASASASATAGGYGGENNNGAARGCNNGCGSNDSVDNFGLAGGLTKNVAGAGSSATAKSSAGANAYGIGGSFASASAHASAGSATKGGYGRK